MIITINGKPGSGKSSLATMLADRLGLAYYDIGALRREAARAKGMTLEEYNRWGETTDETDRDVDAFQEKLGKEKDNLVITGRTSFYFIPHSVKIFLDVSMHDAAKRIFNDKKLNDRNETSNVSSLDEVERSLNERMRSDNLRYKKYYNIDVYDTSLYDFVLDTSGVSLEGVYEKVVSYLKTKGLLTSD